MKWQLYGFFVFWFGVGALITMFFSLFCPDNILLQAIVFLVSSVIGKKGLVIQDINNTFGVGQIKIANEVWSAKTEDDTIIEKGTEINVVRIDGVKAVVEPIVVNSKITN